MFHQIFPTSADGYRGQLYGGHSADLLFHIIILELQYIIIDSSPKKYLGAKYIYWARLFIGPRLFILGAFIYSVHLCNKYVAQLDKTTLFDFPSTPTPTLVNITDCHLLTCAT
jgi:hypothetical protein